MVVAVSGAPRPKAKTQWPSAWSRSLNTSIASISDGVAKPAVSSITETRYCISDHLLWFGTPLVGGRSYVLRTRLPESDSDSISSGHHRDYDRPVIELRTRDEIAAMRPAGRFVAEVLTALEVAARPGVTLLDLDSLAHSMIRDRGAVSCYIDYHPSFGAMPFGKVLCTSVNDAVLHGLPHEYALRDGDNVTSGFRGERGWLGRRFGDHGPRRDAAATGCPHGRDGAAGARSGDRAGGAGQPDG